MVLISSHRALFKNRLAWNMDEPVLLHLDVAMKTLELDSPSSCLGKKYNNVQIPCRHIIGCKVVSETGGHWKKPYEESHANTLPARRPSRDDGTESIEPNEPIVPTVERDKLYLKLTYFSITGSEHDFEGQNNTVSVRRPRTRRRRKNKKSQWSSVRYKTRTLILQAPKDSNRSKEGRLQLVQEWEALLNENMGLIRHKKPLLILVNPKSGVGTALKIFQDLVGPILDEADVPYNMVLTTRSGYGQDLVVNEDLSRWGGIVIISGDGLLYEVVQGLFKRPDWAKVTKIPLSIIAGGSGNGLARTLAFESGDSYHNNGVLASAMSLVRRRYRFMDLLAVQSASGKNVYAFLSIGWGFMADCDIESETLRFMGEPRFVLWSLWRATVFRHYRGRLSYKRAHPKESQGSQTSPADEDSPVDPNWSAKEDYPSSNGAAVHMTPDFMLPPLSKPVPDDWTIMEEDFVMVYATNTAFIATLLQPAPQAKMDDGTIWLLIIKKGVSRLEMIRILRGVEQGTHTDFPSVQIVPVSAFRLEPLGKSGNIVVDGELIDYEPIQAQVLPSYFNIITK
ncbi:hypothetical protein TCAL_13065 [Tigriopus californicus]|uniref:DAGKc domain-containing protein n=2 Tax=Tigriopus californicus TaxID=6832 RepID=A0A553P1R4_TIGCA|nr:hypothetical protein TCAL_13065 [Tigriopus californicus]|eukprot:TCALIF_13065-PA protein Name:"Similar to Sphk1 Sphingosine kinase 1 (Rattus norvegicus)" AED:0.04 eAED:0.04 QI:0/-1/0/1/-1/1/1/0/565